MPGSVFKWFVPYMFIQAFAYQFAKDSLNFASPFTFMAIRYLFASALLLGISRKIIFNRDIIIISSLTSLSTLSWILGLGFVSPGDSAVLNSTAPLFAIPLALAILREKSRTLEVIGAVAGFGGVGIYSLTLTHGSMILGAILTLGGSVTYAAFSTLFRRARRYDPASLVGSQYLIGSIPFVIGAFFFPTIHFTPSFFIDLVYMAIPAGAIQLFLWNHLLRIETVAKVTTLTLIIPAITLSVQSIETLTLPSVTAIVGAIVIFVGIYFSNLGRMKASNFE